MAPLIRLPRVLKRIGALLLGLAFLWSMALFWLPPLVKGPAERLLGEQLGRSVSIGRIEFRPWTLELFIDELVVREASGSGEQFGFNQLYVNLAARSLFKLAPVVDALQLSGPRGHVAHLGEGRYDIDDILARLARPADPPADPSAPPPLFALYNLSINGGAFDFVDQPLGTTHQLRELTVGVPFISSLPDFREVQTAPRLGFRLNGSRFDTQAQSLPFAETRETEARLHIAALDLASYLPYLPEGLPLRLQSGVVDAELRLRFEQTPEATVALSGQLQATGLAARDAADRDVLRVDKLSLEIADLQPLKRRVALASLEIDSPQLQLRREADGRLALLTSSADTASAAPAPASAAAASAASGVAPAAAAPAVPAWTVSLDQFKLRDGQLRWIDHAAAPGAGPAVLLLDGLQVGVRDIRWPFTQPAALQAEARLAAAADETAEAKGTPATLTLSGTATDQAADVQLKLDGADLAMVQPYLAGLLRPALHGQLAAQTQLTWKAPDALVVTAEQVALERLALGGPAFGRDNLASLRRLEVKQARVDLARRSAEVGSVQLDQPQLAVARQRDGRWMFEAWLADAPTAVVSPAPARAPASPSGPAWTYAIANLVLDDGSVDYTDQSLPRPVALAVSGLALNVRGLGSDLGKPMQARLSARVAGQAAAAGSAGPAGRSRGPAAPDQPGRLVFDGQVTPQPLAAQGKLDITALPLAALEPYFGDALNLEVQRADASFAGNFKLALPPAGLALQLAGDLGVQDLRARQREATDERGRELLSWNAMRLGGLALDIAPGTATSLAVAETQLTDFYARIMIDERGRINLQDLVKSNAQAPAAASAAKAAASAPKKTASASLAPRIRFGPIRVQNGRVLFSDRFVKPNYTANLTELHGGLSAFASADAQGAKAQGKPVAPAMAELELRGRAEGTASLEITGKLNPLADPLALDIRGQVRDLELPPLSPYTVKYAGHGIERGKLSVDVHYQIQPDGKLTATNSLVLNQLTFGDPVPDAPASLPVRLATALLADRHGVIDLKLPVQGSLNDPEFSLGPVILKAIANLVVKAVTAPFSLLASAFGGGGEELSTVAFAPGSAVLDDADRQGLDKVATALEDRPQLKLTVVGGASRAVEEDGMRRERLRRMLQAEKRRRAVAAGGAAPAAAQGAASAPLQVTVDPGEEPELLRALYQRAELDKPRNALGVAKDVPPAQMEALLLADMAITDEAVRQLAVQRGVAVRDYLASRKVPLDRLFLGATRIVDTPDWTPRAELELAIP